MITSQHYSILKIRWSDEHITLVVHDPWLLFFSSPKTPFQIFLLSFGTIADTTFVLELCLLHQLSVVLNSFESFDSWLIFFFWYLPSVTIFFSSSPSCHFLAFTNSFGTVLFKGLLKYRYDFSFPVGKSCLKTELQFSDYYCLLAVHVLVDIWRETGKDQWFQFNFTLCCCWL